MTLVLAASVRVVAVGTGTPRFFTIFLRWGGYIGRMETSEEAKLEIKCPPPFLDALAKLRKVTISFVVSVRPRETTRLPLDGFS